MKKNLFTAMAVALLSAALFTSCRGDETSPESQTPYDYSVEANWMVKDFKGKDVDLFYVYPTVVWTGHTSARDLDDNEKKEAYFTYISQAGCMAEDANVYVPYYRQATMDYMDQISTADDLVDTLRNNVGKQDIFAALDYYFENDNGGRPFILASHSQGSGIMRLVFEEYMHKDRAHENYFKRMIAAYALGFTFPKTWMSKVGIKGAQRADDTGVVIAYNTEGPDSQKSNMLVSSDDYVINPLTWTTEEDRADSSLNLGCFVWDDKQSCKYHIAPGVCDAQVDNSRAALICTTVGGYISMPGDPFGDKSLHVLDWGGYYANLGQNAKTRIDAYLTSHK